jgi:hypothetical protein
MNNIGGIRITHTPQAGKTLHEHNQIRVKFPNGYEVSIVYGALAYSADGNGRRISQPLQPEEFASTVEIAIFKPNGDPVRFKDGEDVKGFVTVPEVLGILNWVSTQV